MSIITIKKKMQNSLIPEYVRASGVIPVLAYEETDQIFLMDDKTAGFGFFCDPLIYADEKIQERVNGFLNQEWPTKSTIQILLFRSPDINQEMYRMLGIREGYHHKLMSAVISERERFLKYHTNFPLTSKTSRGFYDMGVLQDLKLCITVKVPIAGNQPTESEQAEIVRLRVKVESSLQTVGLRPTLLNAPQYIRFMSTLLNWGEDTPWRHDATEWDRETPICNQVFDYGTDLQVGKEDLKLGDTHVRVLSAKKMPDVMYFGDAVKYIGDLSGGDSRIKENYMVVVNVFIPDPEKTRSTLDRKRQFAVNQAYGPMLKFVPVLADKKEGFDVLYDSMKEGNKPIKISYSLVIFAPTKERASAAATQAAGLWRESKFEMLADKFLQLPMFINCLPLCSDMAALRDLFRHKTMTTEQATPILPIFGEWKGTGTYHACLLSRNGQIMSLSLHDSDTNKNLVVAAESGSGKSFLVNELVMSYLSEGAQVWVIDVGRSYQKLCEMLEGDFVHFEEGIDISLNPFELVENYADEEDGLVSLVSTMASAKGLLTEIQQAALKQTMSTIWDEKGKKMLVDDIADSCLKSGDDRLKDVGTQLHAFSSKGSYGKYFSKANNVNFQKQFTVLELDELQGRKHLRQVVLLQLIYQIQQEVYLGDRSRKKVVIIDEAWDLLKEGEVAVFMEHAYRKFRKYGGSVVIATQSINDLYENAVGRAIAENSSSMYLLGQTEETVESVKRTGRLALSEGGYQILKGVHTIAGVYSEIFVKSKAGMGVGRLVVGNFQKLLYSTNPDDVAALKAHTDRGLSITNAVQQVMQQRGQI
ncbi:type IV secretion system protein TraC [Eoetvoesiella caeni]